MKIRDEEIYEFIVQVSSSGHFIVVAPGEPIEEINAKFLSLTIQQRIPSFIFDLISNVLASFSDFHILSQESKVYAAIKRYKNEI